ncbi:MAG: protein translocase subunit SecF [Marmoricola sp.]
MGKFSRLGNALYEGDVSVDFVGRKWLWYSISGLIVILAIAGLTFKGLNLGIEFQGGNEYTVPVTSAQLNQSTVGEIQKVVAASGIPGAESPIVNTSGTNSIKVRTETVSSSDSETLISDVAKVVGVSPQNVSQQDIGPSLGKQVTQAAATGLVVFLILVMLFIWAYFREWKMAVAAVVALAHDLVITIGVYALSGFEVTPATVTGLLTILGFSLYDTVVVFDKVRENTKNLRAQRTTYAAAANLAVNQTLVRSINTSVVALLPVAAILYVGVTTLGSGALKDLALALFVGMAAGAYSSIFIASPLLVQLKSREAAVTDAERRAKARSRREADRYASVPVFVEDMPVQEEPEEPAVADAPGARYRAGADEEPVPVRPPTRRPEATGSGRVVPRAKSPVTGSGAAGRDQPSRQPRSKRGKR